MTRLTFDETMLELTNEDVIRFTEKFPTLVKAAIVAIAAICVDSDDWDYHFENFVINYIQNKTQLDVVHTKEEV